MAQARPGPWPAGARDTPRVPPYAWAWLQRSRPVLAEAARRLTGRPPSAGFVDWLRARFGQDPFVRDVLLAVIADVAFGGRVPSRRPAGASWDRGLTWWAAVLAGDSPAAFEARSAAPAGTQRTLFDPAVVTDATPEVAGGGGGRAARADRVDRAVVVRALRDLLANADGDQVPAEAVRQLLAQLERR